MLCEGRRVWTCEANTHCFQAEDYRRAWNRYRRSLFLSPIVVDAALLPHESVRRPVGRLLGSSALFEKGVLMHLPNRVVGKNIARFSVGPGDGYRERLMVDEAGN
jgi:hypothetical protein